MLHFLAAIGCLLALVTTPTTSSTTSPAAAPGQERPTEIRRMRFSEVDSSLGRRARQILDDTRDRPLGTEVVFTHRGRTCMARIERHYHEPGGSARPWGWHRGISLFVVE